MDASCTRVLSATPHNRNTSQRQQYFHGRVQRLGTWPVYSAIRVSDYKVVVRPTEPEEKNRVEVTHHDAPAVLGAIGALLGDATAQPLEILRSTQFVLVHLQGLGDVSCINGEWCGTKGESRRLEGFSILLPPELGNVKISYSCHLQGLGDTPWMTGPNFCGTRGQSRRLEGFSMRLDGPDANRYRLTYQAHLQGRGDTQVVSAGQFAGTKGESRRVEAIRVSLDRR